MTQGDPTVLNTMFKIRRYAPDFPAFENRNLIPIGPIERDPLPSVCDISSDHSIGQPQEGITLYYENGRPYIKNDDPPLDFQLFSFSAEVIKKGSLHSGLTDLSLDEFPSAIYFLKTEFQTLKIIKI